MRTKATRASRRHSYGVRQRSERARRGNAALCPRCGGVGTVWTGEKRITCPKCGGTGLRPKE